MALSPRQGLVAIAAPAWLALAAAGPGSAVPMLCTGAMLWSLPPVASLETALSVLGADRLAAGWAVMIAAMMVPLQYDLFDHIAMRSLRSRRWGMIAAAGAGYAAVWLAAGLVLVPAALLLRMGAVHWLAALLPVLGAALVWQISPLRHSALNACHRLPPFAAFGWRGYRDAARSGLARGGWCVLACWAIMLLLLALPAAHLPAMALAAGYLAIERAERPRPPQWGWRWPERTARAIAHRFDMMGKQGVTGT
jgi:predicted metal-binding membrane protein